MYVYLGKGVVKILYNILFPQIYSFLNGHQNSINSLFQTKH